MLPSIDDILPLSLDVVLKDTEILTDLENSGTANLKPAEKEISEDRVEDVLSTEVHNTVVSNKLSGGNKSGVNHEQQLSQSTDNCHKITKRNKKRSMNKKDIPPDEDMNGDLMHRLRDQIHNYALQGRNVLTEPNGIEHAPLHVIQQLVPHQSNSSLSKKGKDTLDVPETASLEVNHMDVIGTLTRAIESVSQSPSQQVDIRQFLREKNLGKYLNHPSIFPHFGMWQIWLNKGYSKEVEANVNRLIVEMGIF